MKKPIRSIKKLLKEEALKVKAKCAYCGCSYDDRRHRVSIDHVTPKFSKGVTELSNLLVVCTHCNSTVKCNLSLSEFLKLYPKAKYFLSKYMLRIKKIFVNKVSYYESIKWIEEYLS